MMGTEFIFNVYFDFVNLLAVNLFYWKSSFWAFWSGNTPVKSTNKSPLPARACPGWPMEGGRDVRSRRQASWKQRIFILFKFILLRPYPSRQILYIKRWNVRMYLYSSICILLVLIWTRNKHVQSFPCKGDQSYRLALNYLINRKMVANDQLAH